MSAATLLSCSSVWISCDVLFPARASDSACSSDVLASAILFSLLNSVPRCKTTSVRPSKLPEGLIESLGFVKGAEGVRELLLPAMEGAQPEKRRGVLRVATRGFRVTLECVLDVFVARRTPVRGRRARAASQCRESVVRSAALLRSLEGSLDWPSPRPHRHTANRSSTAWIALPSSPAAAQSLPARASPARPTPPRAGHGPRGRDHRRQSPARRPCWLGSTRNPAGPPRQWRSTAEPQERAGAVLASAIAGPSIRPRRRARPRSAWRTHARAVASGSGKGCSGCRPPMRQGAGVALREIRAGPHRLRRSVEPVAHFRSGHPPTDSGLQAFSRAPSGRLHRVQRARLGSGARVGPDRREECSSRSR